MVEGHSRCLFPGLSPSLQFPTVSACVSRPPFHRSHTPSSPSLFLSGHVIPGTMPTPTRTLCGVQFLQQFVVWKSTLCCWETGGSSVAAWSSAVLLKQKNAVNQLNHTEPRALFTGDFFCWMVATFYIPVFTSWWLWTFGSKKLTIANFVKAKLYGKCKKIDHGQVQFYYSRNKLRVKECFGALDFEPTVSTKKFDELQTIRKQKALFCYNKSPKGVLSGRMGSPK